MQPIASFTERSPANRVARQDLRFPQETAFRKFAVQNTVFQHFISVVSQGTAICLVLSLCHRELYGKHECNILQVYWVSITDMQAACSEMVVPPHIVALQPY